jgi:hypothetical protein
MNIMNVYTPHSDFHYKVFDTAARREDLLLVASGVD